jgi:hypothetical protein
MLLVTEQRHALADGDHIVVEDAGIDRVGILLRKHRAVGSRPWPTRDGGRGLAGLSGRKFCGPAAALSYAARPKTKSSTPAPSDAALKRM